MLEPGYESGNEKGGRACFMYSWTWQLKESGNEGKRGDAWASTTPLRYMRLSGESELLF